MKQLFFVLALLVSVFSFEKNTSAQSLHLDAIDGFPDSVIDGQVVGMSIIISNTGGAFFNSDLAILIHTDSSLSPVDTLFYDTSYTLQNTFTDTIVITHTFNAADYDEGDNIVVVWPASSQSAILVDPDSLVFPLIFRHLGVPENDPGQEVSLYPNPAAHFVNLEIDHPEKVEQVRIVDVLGKDLLNFSGAVEKFSVESLSSGIYFVEVRNKDQSFIVRKFFRE